MTKSESYGPDKVLVAVWALLVSPPAIIGGHVFLRSPSSETLLLFLLALAFLLAPVVFASRFRATFAPTEFIYRRWGRTIRVPYAEIERIEVANLTPLLPRPAKQRIGAFIVTKCGSRLPFWPKLFPRDAVERFFALAG